MTLSACTARIQGQVGEADSLEVMSVVGIDTVMLVHAADTTGIRWARGRLGRVWYSGSLLGGRPEVNLLDIDGDAIPDLYYTLEFEGFILGRLWLGRSDSEVQAFRSAADVCRIPELRDVTGDGLLDVVDFTAFGLSAAECSESFEAETCRNTYPTDWPVVWVQRKAGQFVADSSLARPYYRDVAATFRSAARELRLAILKGTWTASPRCSEGLAKAIERMAQRAGAIGELRP